MMEETFVGIYGPFAVPALMLWWYFRALSKGDLVLGTTHERALEDIDELEDRIEKIVAEQAAAADQDRIRMQEQIDTLRAALDTMTAATAAAARNGGGP